MQACVFVILQLSTVLVVAMAVIDCATLYIYLMTDIIFIQIQILLIITFVKFALFHSGDLFIVIFG